MKNTNRETYPLPVISSQELLHPSAAVSSKNVPGTFDVLIHLLGSDTNMPQFFSIVQFPAKRHFIITSAESSEAEKNLRHLLPQDAEMKTKIVDAFIPSDSEKAVAEIVHSLPSKTKIGVNLTGGTKLMFAGGLIACHKLPDIEPFYFDIKRHSITFIRSGINIPFKGVTAVDGFFTACGFDISSPGKWEDYPVREARKNLTLKLWEKRKIFDRLYQNKEFREYKFERNKPNPPFHFSSAGLIAKFKGGKVSLTLDGENITVPDCTDFGAYLEGGWLEEYAWLQLAPFVKSGKIFDLRIGMEIIGAGQTKEANQMPSAEFDCAFTDGKRLFLVECKAGIVKQEHIQKLENNVKKYGGITAKGILFPALPLGSQQQKRISASASLRTFSPAELNAERLEALIFS